MVITTDILFHMLFERCRIRVRRFSGWSDIYQRNITLNAPNAREKSSESVHTVAVTVAGTDVGTDADTATGTFAGTNTGAAVGAFASIEASGAAGTVIDAVRDARIIKNVRILRDSKPEAGYLYLSDDRWVLENVALSKDYVSLYCGENHETLLNTDFITEKRDVLLLAEEISDIVQSLQEWESELLKILSGGGPMASMFRIGQDLLERPLLLLSRNSAVIAHTPDLSDVVGEDRQGKDRGILQGITELLVDEVFHSEFQQEGIFYYPSYPCDGRYICSNIYNGDRYLSRLITPLRSGELELSPGEEQLFGRFAEYVKQLYLKYADDSFVHHQEDRLHRALRSLLSEQSERAGQKAVDVFKDYGWDRGHKYLVLKLRFKEGAEWESTALHLCGQLEKEVPFSCAIRLEAHILWAVNLTRSKLQKDVQPFFQTLAYFVREYLCQAGVSDISSDLLDARSMLMQAERALEVGQKKDPHYWYYRFGQYALDYMLEQVTNEFSGDKICAKPLLKLIEYDRENCTEYVKTLYEYIQSKYNATLAAERLYVHRTTFIRRLERIRNIADIDEDNMDELLHILLSFKLLGIGQEYIVG